MPFARQGGSRSGRDAHHAPAYRRSRPVPNLTEIERAELMARWMDITRQRAEGLSAQVGQKVDSLGRTGAHRPQGGISQAPRDLGLSRQQLSRATKIAALSPEAKAAARAKGVETQAPPPARWGFNAPSPGGQSAIGTLSRSRPWEIIDKPRSRSR